MSEYMLMVLDDEGAQKAVPPKEMARVIEGQAAFAKKLASAGVLKDQGRLRPSSEGKRVSRDGDRVSVQDGPFAEDGRAIGGYYLVDSDSLDSAALLANDCPTLPADGIDVRPLMGGKHESDKASKQGKVFAFAVLGKAENEKAWVDIMDRIDAETSANFPDDSFLGGMRLHSPKKGRRVVAKSGQRAILDGPFLESKEVIGGMFFMRLSSMDEAVKWAGTTPFMNHGSLEIRELWRS